MVLGQRRTQTAQQSLAMPGMSEKKNDSYSDGLIALSELARVELSELPTRSQLCAVKLRCSYQIYAGECKTRKNRLPRPLFSDSATLTRVHRLGHGGGGGRGILAQEF